MDHLVITLNPNPHRTACVLCGRPTTLGGGPNLTTSDGLEVVCPPCGRQHAPVLTRLLQLARVAERVGRMERHTLMPPLTALLELARAAEDYARAVPQPRRQAA